MITALPGAALANGYGHGGSYGHHGWWWGPGAILGGVALGVAALVTAPFWALSAASAYPPPVAYAPPVPYATPPAYGPPAAYAPPPPSQSVPGYAQIQAAPPLQREIVYPTGRYVLYGDGVRQPWQWVWVPAAPLPPAP